MSVYTNSFNSRYLGLDKYTYRCKDCSDNASCILHNKDTNKDTDKFYRHLKARLVNPQAIPGLTSRSVRSWVVPRIIDKAVKPRVISGLRDIKSVDWVGVVFPEKFNFVNFNRDDVPIKNINIDGATSDYYMNFSNIKITGIIRANKLVCKEDIIFRLSTIVGDVNFEKSSIGRNASFSGSLIGRNAYFSESSIGGHAKLDRIAIVGDWYFSPKSIGWLGAIQDGFIGGRLKLNPPQGVDCRLEQMVAGGIKVIASQQEVTVVNCWFARLSISARHAVRFNNCTYCLPANPLNKEWERKKDILEALLKKVPETAKEFNQSIKDIEGNDIKTEDVYNKLPFLKVYEQQNLSDLQLDILKNHLQNSNGLLDSLQKSYQKISGMPVPEVDDFLSKDPAKLENKRYWDLANCQLEKLELVECDLAYADFTSSDLEGVYFDSCTWNNKQGPDALMLHGEWMKLYKKIAKCNGKQEPDALMLHDEWM